MFSNWHDAIKRILISFLVLLLTGWLVGEPALVVLAGTLSYLIYHLIQLRKLYNWLRDADFSEPSPPPESKGIWGYILDGIYLLQHRERQALIELKNAPTENVDRSLFKFEKLSISLLMQVI